jgi:hypothetical protein
VAGAKKFQATIGSDDPFLLALSSLRSRVQQHCSAERVLFPCAAIDFPKELSPRAAHNIKYKMYNLPQHFSIVRRNNAADFSGAAPGCLEIMRAFVQKSSTNIAAGCPSPPIAAFC